MTIKNHLRDILILFLIACIPAIAQLAMHGLSAPGKIPFGIFAEEITQRKESIVWVDARKEEVFKQEHIPGAVNLNRYNWDQSLQSLYEKFEPGKTIVVYCSPDCTESEEIASRIRELGIDPVLVLEGGYQAWKKINHDS